MNDQFNENQPVREDGTRAVPPVATPAEEAPAPTRRRRSQRYEDVQDQATPAGSTTVQPPVTAKFDTGVPSQGMPASAARQEEKASPETPTVRQPVKDPNYHPLGQLGSRQLGVDRPSNAAPQGRPPVRTPHAARQQARSGSTGRMGNASRMGNTGSTGLTAPFPPEHADDDVGGSGGLIAIILVLLVVAAMIIGLIMIPEDDPGFLGDVKRAVTTPIKALLGEGAEDEKANAAQASGFTATLAQATAPYKVVFSLVTSDDVTAVRIVDEQGGVLPTATTMSSPNTESTLVWMFEATLETGYAGTVQAQVQQGGEWVDSGLKQTLSIGTGALATITSGQSAVPSAATTAPVTDEPTEAPVTDAPTAEPTADDDTTPTPTLSVTATPTLVPTSTPSLEPTEEPTPTPTLEPTEAPTPTPSPTPYVTPKLEADAAAAADPALIAVETVWKDGKKTESFEREKPLNMPAANDYLTRDFGVTTFRQNAFRQNAASGTVTAPTSMSLLWTVEAGTAKGESRNYYGIGWTGQPLIVKWSRDVREGLDIKDEFKSTVLKEVIVAGYDGRIYFLDLETGAATREVIDLGYPMRSTPTVSSLSYPMMTVGQFARKMASGTSKNIGLYYYSLIDQKRLHLIDGLDRDRERLYYEVGAFDTSALIDRNTNTLIALGTNGMLYTQTLDTTLHYDKEMKMVLDFEEPAEVSMISRTKGQKASLTSVESSLAMYGEYVFYADMGGVLRCVNTTTMTTEWAVETGDAVRASIALDLDEETRTLWLYTANTIYNSRTKGDVTIRRFNAMTGEEDWAYAIHCAEGKKKDVTFNKVIVPGAIASPVVGREGLNGLVYFTLSSVSKTGAAQLGGTAAMDGLLLALDKATGKVVWHKEMDAYCYSSPVAVYDESGRGWIIQASANGMLYLMDGLTGEVISTLQVNGVIEGSPAVYNNTLVIGTTGKDTSYIYGIALN